MDIRFEFDERKFRKQIEQAAEKAVGESVRKSQIVFDRVHRQYSGRPVGEVLVALRSETRRIGWSASDADLRPYAQAISDGTRVVLKPGKTRW